MSCSIRLLLRKSFLLRDVLPFDTDRARLTYLGRNAIWQAVRILGLNPGDEVLVPAYNCGSEIDPLLHHGLTIVPYRVSQSAQIDVKDIRSRVSRRTRAVYVTHYFGFPQRLEEIVHFCRERGLFLVEDCALALFSRAVDGFVGRMGDVAIYSFRKTVPVPDGGAVVINNPSLKMVGPLEQPSLAPVLAALIPSLGRSAERWSHIEWNGIERAYRSVKYGINRLYKERRPSGTQGEFVKVGGVARPSLSWQDHYDPRISHWAMSTISKRIIANINPQEVVARRRANFQYLLEALRDVAQVEPLFEQHPEGVCPTAFPVLTERRSQLYTGLTQRGIGAIEWWSGYHPGICWDEFPEASYLKAHIVALPVHHELDRDDMAYLAASVREVLEMSAADENRARCPVSAVTC
ncbi:dTDP-4-amino-4,6-dideoxygalactose transaminase [subsurface metagenome]